jgi:crotonobetainyl-CoA:carnitine CoA-transferase CaiB-like acyl-CoA transferase
MLPFQALPQQTLGAGFAHLQGVKILDLTTSVAGPYATQLLADFGATVIKVEKRDGGDDARAWGPPFLNGESLWFMSMNRNKHSITLDVALASGRKLLLSLLEQADVLVVNMTPRVQKKLGLSYDALKDQFPKLVHASLTGFGLEGARRDFPCYDLIAEGYSGIMDLTGEMHTPPQKVGTPAADLLAGYDLALSIMAALMQRTQTGLGTCIDVSMIASMSRFCSPRIMSYLGSSEVPRRSGGKDSVIAIYQVFDTADAPISLGLGNDAIWHRFWTVVEEPEFGQQPDYKDNTARREYRTQIVEKISNILATQGRSHWLDLFAQHRIPAGPINQVDEITQDAELLEQGFFFQTEGQAGPLPQVGLGIRMGGRTDVLRKAPPVLGQDTDDILQNWLGMTDPEIQKLKDAGTI